MSALLRDRAWRLGFGFLVLAALSAAVFVFRNDTSSAFPGMPVEQRAYWEWVSTIGADEDAALASGLSLLAEHPDLTPLYGRLAELCLNGEEPDLCRASLGATEPASPRAALHRDAALVEVDGDPEAWKHIAASPDLDPALARTVVDRTRQDAELLGEIESGWEDMLASDSLLAGASFGLGYAAVMRNDWDRAMPYLEHTTKIAPDDPQAYREFGRMYFYTGDYDGFVASLETGIENARRAHDIEQEVILRGNLGLGYLQWKGDLEKAGEMFASSLEQAKALNIGRTIAIGGYRLANVRAREHRYEEALALMDSAEVWYESHAPERTSELLALRGQVFEKTYRYTEAEQVLEEALAGARANNDKVREAQSLLALAQLRTKMGRYADAHDAAEAALAIATAYNAADYIISAREVLGEAERLSGNFRAAEEHFQAGLDVANKTNSPARIAELSKELGVSALLLGDLGAAQRYFDVFRQSGDRSELAEAEALYWIGNTYLFYDNFDLASENYREALDALGGEDSRLAALVKRNLASAVFSLGDPAEALVLLGEAAEALGADPLQSYALDVARGHVLIATGESADALRHFDRAEGTEDELEWSAIHWYALYGRALAHWSLGEFEEAERAFRDAVTVIETLRDHLEDPEDRSFFIHDKTEVYDDFSTFLQGRGRMEEAFHIHERARSRTLVDLLYSTQYARRLDMTRPVDRVMEMARQVKAVEDEIIAGALHASEAKEDGDAYRKNRAAYLRRARTRVDAEHRRAELDIFGSKRLYTFDPVGADSLRAILDDDEAVVVYNLSEAPRRQEERPSVAYVISKRDVRAVNLDADAKRIVEAVRFFRSTLEGPSDGSAWRTASARIYDDLMAPVVSALPDGVTHLNVVPEGPLHYLPFAALSDERGRFLIERYSLSVVPSATILKLSRERNPQHWSYMLLLADPDDRLPGAREEVLSIAADSPSRRHALVGKEASQQMFERVASRYDVIHFATHGNFDSRAPWDSHLELHGDVLTVDEIGKLTLDAYLVTLSACETALASGLVADIPNGDEWVGLNQAFLAAGTPSVMASLWPIDDRFSSTMMTEFYHELGSAGKAKALASVQRAMIADPASKHPFYWAAFTIIGDPL